MIKVEVSQRIEIILGRRMLQHLKLLEALEALLMMWSIYEIIHFWTAVVDESVEWSSQWIFPI